jgi:hypothetical protein
VVAILSKRGRRWVVTTRSREAHDIGRADDLVMTSGVLIVVLAGLGAFLVVFAGRALSSAHFAHSLRTQATRDEPAPVPPQGAASLRFIRTGLTPPARWVGAPAAVGDSGSLDSDLLGLGP